MQVMHGGGSSFDSDFMALGVVEGLAEGGVLEGHPSFNGWVKTTDEGVDVLIDVVAWGREEAGKVADGHGVVINLFFQALSAGEQGGFNLGGVHSGAVGVEKQLLGSFPLA